MEGIVERVWQYHREESDVLMVLAKSRLLCEFTNKQFKLKFRRGLRSFQCQIRSSDSFKALG
jgi:hypothetical protein